MRILLVEENGELCASLSFQLEKAGCQTDLCDNSADLVYYLSQHIYDIILLDQLLYMDGQTIFQKLRADKDTTPVIFLTTPGEYQNLADSRQAAAVDYLVKPFAFEELLERIRRISRWPAAGQQNEVFRFGDITYYSAKQLLTGPAGQCVLSKREGTLLQIFLENPLQTLSRRVLLTKVWGPDAQVEEGNLDNYMYLVRRRLKSVGSGTAKIHTIRGIGYQLENLCSYNERL